jgi:thiol-disulfide isomerase/thioredoxin
MYRKLIYIIFFLSLSCNVYVVYDYCQRLQEKYLADAFIENVKIKNISLKEGDDFLFEKIKSSYPELKNKKYYFISIWNTMCGPCIKEMPLLDSLADTINRNDFGFIFLTENGDKMIREFIERRKISSKNFNFINDADVYISSILQSHHLKTRQYPIQLIIDINGDMKYFKTGTIETTSDSLVINCIRGL